MELVVFVTCPSREEAIKIARSLIEERVAACVNVIDRLKSIYWWQGKVEEDDEVLLIIKTSDEAFTKVVDKVRELHSYTVPEIIALPIVRGFEGYLKWLRENVTGK